MSERKLISPMLDNFAMGDPISEHNGVCCCPAMENDSDQKYIVKIISTPSSQTQLDALLLSGAFANQDAALQYFQSVTDSILEEAQVLQKLSQHEGFLPFEKYQAVPMEDGIGFDLYLLSIYRRTLQKQLKRTPMTHLSALNLGLDLCAALAICRRLGYLYVDLKPENIYITAENEYRIGDLGFIKLDSVKYASLPERYRSAYTAPEIQDAYSSLNVTLDTYALGLILYQVFNDGALPIISEASADQLPPPAYADYEMAEIILKACAINPEERWQDPIEMGQALVSYMQRNGAHDTPIVPQSIPTENTSTVEETGAYEETDPSSDVPAMEEQQLEDIAENNEIDPDVAITEEDIFTEDEEGNLTYIADNADDETIPDENDADVDYGTVSEEVTCILNQADELIAHPAPEPVIPPEPIEVTIPEIPVEEAAIEEQDEENSTDETLTKAEPEQQEDENAAPADDEVTNDPPIEEETIIESNENNVTVATEENDTPEQDSEVVGQELNTSENEDEPAETETADKQNKSPLIWVRNILLVLLALAVVAVGVLYYKNYYLQPIESIVIEDYDQGVLTVIINSQIDESKLHVVCSDTYGNPLTAPVDNGRAVFEGLAPNSAYTVEVVIDGFHRLTGVTTTAFTTPEETNIVQFQAVTGAEDGSVILSFTVEGPDANQWTVHYTASNEPAKEVSFTGHMATLTGLTVGKEYAFSLVPDIDLIITGTDKISYTASKLVKAENLAITSCVEGKLTAQWSAPSDTAVDSWTVRCYADNGYDQTIVVNETSVVFEGVDESVGYTVEVAAAGMSISERYFAAPGSITVKDFTVTETTPNQLSVSWSCNTDKSWKLQYTLNNSFTQEIICDNQTGVQIENIVPGTDYQFTLSAVDGNNVLGGQMSYRTADATKFSGYGVNAELIAFNMCKTPSKSNWDRYDVDSSDYTTEFKIGKKASFLARMRHEYDVSSDKIVTLYVIRDSNSAIVSVASTTQKWSSMWRKNYGEFDIPALPQTPGEYEVSIYFNGALVKTQAFTMVQ